MAREAWTDERLDDLKEGMHREFHLMRKDMDRRFDKVDDRLDGIETRFDALNARFDALNARFDATQRTIVAGCLSIAAAIIAAGIF